MHRKLGGDFVVRQIIEQFQERALLATVEEKRAMPPVALRPSIARIAAIVVSRAAPDVLEPLLPRHRPDRTTFPLDDGQSHMLGHRTFGQVAISMEVTDDPIDAQAEEH